MKDLKTELAKPCKLRTNLLDGQEGLISAVEPPKMSDLEVTTLVVRFKDNRIAILKSIVAKPECKEEIKAFEDNYKLALELGQATWHIARPVTELKKAVNKNFVCCEFLQEWGGLALNRFETLNPVQIIDWMTQSLQAIIEMEKKPVPWYYDIKPSNMACLDGYLKITDFGCARIMKRQNLSAKTPIAELASLGVTVEYCPPEFFLYIKNNKTSFSKSAFDIYCWAMSFYQLINKASMERLTEELETFKKGKTKVEYDKFIDIVKSSEKAHEGPGKKVFGRMIVPILVKALNYDWKNRGTLADILAALKALMKPATATFYSEVNDVILNVMPKGL